MQAITIAERLWLEPTMLGATLNYADGKSGWHFRVGLAFRSLGECDQVIKGGPGAWVLKDKSLIVESNGEITLTFCPGSVMEQQLILTGAELQTFKNAIHFLALASMPHLN